MEHFIPLLIETESLNSLASVVRCDKCTSGVKKSMVTNINMFIGLLINVAYLFTLLDTEILLIDPIYTEVAKINTIQINNIFIFTHVYGALLGIIDSWQLIRIIIIELNLIALPNQNKAKKERRKRAKKESNIQLAYL